MGARNLNDDFIREKMVSLRKLAGFTQKEVEKELGLRDMFVYDFEAGRIKLPFSVGVALLDLYRISPDIAFPLQTFGNRKVMGIDSATLPMFQLGLLETHVNRLIEFMHQDPAIAGKVGIDKLVLGKPLLTSLLECIPENNQLDFVLILYKCIQSLISCDNTLSDTELVLRDMVLNYPAMELSKNDVASIQACTGVHYLPEDSDRVLDSEALKHFVVWVLFVMALCDGSLDRREESYIRKIAEHIGLSKTAYYWIREKIDTPVQEQY